VQNHPIRSSERLQEVDAAEPADRDRRAQKAHQPDRQDDAAICPAVDLVLTSGEILSMRRMSGKNAARAAKLEAEEISAACLTTIPKERQRRTDGLEDGEILPPLQDVDRKQEAEDHGQDDRTDRGTVYRSGRKPDFISRILFSRRSDGHRLQPGICRADTRLDPA